MAELLQDTSLSGEQRLYTDTIKNSGEALLVIINDVLDYSKIEAKKLLLNLEPFDLKCCIHEVVLLMLPKARAQGLNILLEYEPLLPTQFVGDPGRLRQILTNLLGNAVKFTEKGHVLIRVTGVTNADDTAQVQIVVEDTGIGIPNDKISDVFGEFNQIDGDHNRRFQGTGLGLAISQHLVRMMGGQIWAESALGRGSTFGLQITLPLVDAADQPGPSSISEPGRAMTLDANDPSPITKQRRALRVLAAEDNKTNRLVFSKMVAKLDIDLVFAENGVETVELYRSFSPDIVFMDISMPLMDGKQATRQIRAIEQMSGRHVPVVAMTAHAMDGDPAAVLAAGLDHYLSKPLRKAAIHAQIAAACPPDVRPPGVLVASG